MVLRRMAARTPRGTATTSARTSAPPVSCSVGPRRSTISVATGSPVLNDRPRSPRSAARIQLAYCVSERAIEAEARADLRGDLGGELAADQNRLRPAGRQAHDREQDHGNTEQHEPRVGESFDDVAGQALSPEISVARSRLTLSRSFSRRQRRDGTRRAPCDARRVARRSALFAAALVEQPIDDGAGIVGRVVAGLGRRPRWWNVRFHRLWWCDSRGNHARTRSGGVTVTRHRRALCRSRRNGRC